jgi:hypothetical protein
LIGEVYGSSVDFQWADERYKMWGMHSWGLVIIPGWYLRIRIICVEISWWGMYLGSGLLLTSQSPTCFLFSLLFRILKLGFRFLKRKNEFSVKHY